MTEQTTSRHRVVIVGGGFAGLYAARSLGTAPVHVTVIDRRNFHLFQPLLYQVATGNVAPSDIASSLRGVLSRYDNVGVRLGEMVDLDPDERKVILSDGDLVYDTLILATGVRPHYFAHAEWARWAIALKTIEDAVEMRRRILLSFEAAEKTTDLGERLAWLTFAVVGVGSAGVELSGALGELAHQTLRRNFRCFDPSETKILLIEAADRILPAYSPKLSARAQGQLEKLGVTVLTGARVTDLDAETISLRREGSTEQIRARTILWTAGIRASPIADLLARRAGVELDRLHRVVVEPDLTLPGRPDIYVLGDLASYTHGRSSPLPALAPVAIQQGQYVSKAVRARVSGKRLVPFRYIDKGNLAVIGRNAAVAELGRFQFGGFVAWLLWGLVHIMYLIGFDHKVLVMFRWVWNYVTRRRGTRLITETRT